MFTGRLGADPKPFGKDGTNVELRLVDQPQTRNRDTGEYIDDGAPIWINVPLWGSEARKCVAAAPSKGDFVTVTGELKLEQYETRDGEAREQLQLRYTHFMGVFPGKWYRTPTDPHSTPESRSKVAKNASNAYPSPEADPWGTQPGF